MEKIRIYCDALQAVCLRTHGVKYNGWQLLSVEDVRREIEDQHVYIDSFLEKLLRENVNLVSKLQDEKQAVSLPF